MDQEIARIKRNYPGARYVGISDGASDYLPWLKEHTTTQVLDFWHVTEYIHTAAAAVHAGNSGRETWIERSCHELKHEHGAAARILEQFRAAACRKMSSDN